MRIWLISIALLLAGTVIWDASRQNSVTVDEVGHAVAGIAYWERGDFFVYHHSPPLARYLMALPVMAAQPVVDYSRSVPDHPGRVEHAVGRDFMFANAERFHQLVLRARSVTVLLTLLGGLLLWRWGSQLHGSMGGVLAATVWLTDPMVIAHGGLATTDVAAAVLGLAGSYALWLYLKAPSMGRWLAFSLLTALGLLTKYSLLLTLPVAMLALGLARKSWHCPGWKLLAQFLLVNGLLLHLGYAGQGSFRPLKEFQFASSTLSGQPPGLRGNRFEHSVLGSLPSPLPAEYLQGLDAQRADFERGWTSYFRGETREYGWLGYYLYGYVVKSPLGTLLLLVCGGLVLIGHRRRMRPEEHVLLVLPIVLVHLTLALNTGMNHHIRYTLVCFPYLCLLVGWLGPWSERSQRWGRALLGLGLALNLFALIRIHPQELAFFNPLAGGPEAGHHHLADSNIDWGQDLIRLREWQDAHPEATPLGLAFHSIVDPEIYGIQYRLAPPGPTVNYPGADANDGPQPGWYAVSINQFLGLPFPLPDGAGGLQSLPPGAYTYFQNFEPAARCGYGLLLFNLRPDVVARVRRKLGMPALSETDRSEKFTPPRRN